MADEIQVSARLYAAKGGAFLGAETTNATVDMAGSHMGDSTQTIGNGADEVLAIPADVTGNHWLLVKNCEPEGGNYVELSLATGGSFAASVFTRVLPQTAILICAPGAVYAKANTAPVLVQHKTTQV